MSASVSIFDSRATSYYNQHYSALHEPVSPPAPASPKGCVNAKIAASRTIPKAALHLPNLVATIHTDMPASSHRTFPPCTPSLAHIPSSSNETEDTQHTRARPRHNFGANPSQIGFEWSMTATSPPPPTHSHHAPARCVAVALPLLRPARGYTSQTSHSSKKKKTKDNHTVLFEHGYRDPKLAPSWVCHGIAWLPYLARRLRLVAIGVTGGNLC